MIGFSSCLDREIRIQQYEDQSSRLLNTDKTPNRLKNMNDFCLIKI